MSHSLERTPGMVNLSDLVIYNPQVRSFPELLVLVAQAARDGARFLNYDVTPDYRDTPRKWHVEVERAFSLGARYLGERS